MEAYIEVLNKYLVSVSQHTDPNNEKNPKLSIIQFNRAAYATENNSLSDD
jgi:hypothetical protein